jgi:hypothetical protein
MRKRKRTDKSKSKIHSKVKTDCAEMKMCGLSIDIPHELDSPAGAPVEIQNQPAPMRIPDDVQEMLGPLVEVATNTWRLKVRMIDPDTSEPKEETRKLFRFVEGLFRALDDAGIQVIDKTGKPYDNGMSEKVISFEQIPGLMKEEIIETIRPSVRWKGRPIHNGEIIVGIPVIKILPEDTPTIEIHSNPSETTTESAQIADTTDITLTRSRELPDSEKDGSINKPEPDLAVSNPQSVTIENNSESEQLETRVSENPVRRAAQNNNAESSSKRPEDAIKHPVASHNSRKIRDFFTRKKRKEQS